MRLGAAALQAAVAVLVCAAVSPAQEWARAMFDRTAHDFGVVARGAKVEYRFVVENIYEEDAHIQSVSSSCGCSTPHATKQLLKTWEKSEIVVALDTRGFLGQKDATITVVFDLPFPAEVQLHVHAYIRGDIVVTPGAAEFGSVNQGAGASRTLKISYAGREDWRIDRVECANPHIEAQLAEAARIPGLINYSLSVNLKKDAPPGYFRDQLFLVTNDRDARSARVPVVLEGVVAAAWSIRPSPLVMGTVEIGQSVTRNLVVQSQTPFRILGVSSTEGRFTAKIPEGAKAVQIIPVTFSAKDADIVPGKVAARLRIETDIGNPSFMEADAVVEVLPAASTGP